MTPPFLAVGGAVHGSPEALARATARAARCGAGALLLAGALGYRRRLVHVWDTVALACPVYFLPSADDDPTLLPLDDLQVVPMRADGALHFVPSGVTLTIQGRRIGCIGDTPGREDAEARHDLLGGHYAALVAAGRPSSYLLLDEPVTDFAKQLETTWNRLGNPRLFCGNTDFPWHAVRFSTVPPDHIATLHL